DLEEKAERLRSLLEEEEILVEQYSRVESESRERLEETRNQVGEFLDYIHEELIGLEKVRTAACLNSMTKSSTTRTGESGAEGVDYEKLLDELEEDLKVVHTVPIVQVKRVLNRWVASIKKEVENLFASNTLRRVTAEQAKQLESSGKLHGLMVLYVDDILYLSDKDVIEAVHRFITEEWPTSPLEWLNEHKAVRYLGVEILREPRVDEHGSRHHVYTVGQSAYVQDLLRSHEMQEVHPTQLPVPREWVEEAEASDEIEEGFSEDTLRQAQRVVGEGLWLSTRTRPDVLYVVNHLASLVSKTYAFNLEDLTVMIVP
ncbi:TY2B-DR3, partial [Symbiodinium necroappetens]